MAAEPPTLHTILNLDGKIMYSVIAHGFSLMPVCSFQRFCIYAADEKCLPQHKSLTFSLAKGNCITMICTWWKFFNFFITSLDRKSGAATLVAQSWCQRDLYSSCIQVCLHQSPTEDIEQKHCNQFKILLPEKDHTCVNCDTTFSNICFFTTSLKFWDFNSNQILW